MDVPETMRKITAFSFGVLFVCFGFVFVVFFF